MLSSKNREQLEDTLTAYVVEVFEEARKKKEYTLTGVNTALDFLTAMEVDADLELDYDEEEDDDLNDDYDSGDYDDETEEKLKKGVAGALRGLIHATRELVKATKKK